MPNNFIHFSNPTIEKKVIRHMIGLTCAGFLAGVAINLVDGVLPTIGVVAAFCGISFYVIHRVIKIAEKDENYSR